MRRTASLSSTCRACLGGVVQTGSFAAGGGGWDNVWSTECNSDLSNPHRAACALFLSVRKGQGHHYAGIALSNLFSKQRRPCQLWCSVALDEDLNPLKDPYNPCNLYTS